VAVVAVVDGLAAVVGTPDPVPAEPTAGVDLRAVGPALGVEHAESARQTAPRAARRVTRFIQRR
jgi:hypothetical protein